MELFRSEDCLCNECGCEISLTGGAGIRVGEYYCGSIESYEPGMDLCLVCVNNMLEMLRHVVMDHPEEVAELPTVAELAEREIENVKDSTWPGEEDDQKLSDKYIEQVQRRPLRCRRIL